MEPVILPDARKHGVNDDDMLHALRNHIRLYDMGDDFTMAVGPAANAMLLEIGFVESTE